MPHVPFFVVYTLLTLALACGPAVSIWAIWSSLMDTPLHGVYAASVATTDVLANEVLDSQLRAALRLLDANLFAGDREMAVQVALMQSSGLLHLDLHPNATNIDAKVIEPYRLYNFDALKGQTQLSYIFIGAAMTFPGQPDPKTVFYIMWQAMNVDRVDKNITRTLYYSDFRLFPDEQSNEMHIWYPDQITGAPSALLLNMSFSNETYVVSTPKRTNGWGDDLVFDVTSGQVELVAFRWFNVANTLYKIEIGLNSQTLSDEVRAALHGSQPDCNGRIFIFFRNGHGHLIAASHGPFYGGSDVDSRVVDPIAASWDMDDFEPLTCLNSTDRFIREACQQLLARYGTWVTVPEVRLEMALQGRRFWVRTGFSQSSLAATVVNLVDREPLMGPIDASDQSVLQHLADEHRVVLGVVIATASAAVALSIAVGVWLAVHMFSLSRGLNRIAALDFRGIHVIPSVCQEIHDFQQSFLQMERGLRAFAQFVPQAVVTQLVAGQLRPEDAMASQPLTIMFADIVGFSTIAESLSAGSLVETCAEYFEVMCKQVVECDGTVDKIIGDCVMALWNAPEQREGHQFSAVTAAMAMQRAVWSLHNEWAIRGMPRLMFRMGIHTGTCLVGNFGCSHRVSYTCLGSNVNLTSRLEALNKRFGTAICVSQSTYDGCRGDFHFRHLAKIPAPGQCELLSVYEVLCETTDDCDTLNDSAVNSGSVVYHWTQRPVADVLAEAEEYEAAYDALAAGRAADCLALLRHPPPDRAWQALAAQCERQAGLGAAWNGVFGP